MRKPVVQVIGQSGSDLIPGWSQLLKSVRFTDNEGGDADEIEFEFVAQIPFQDPPADGTQYQLLYGWEGEALRDAGTFTYQSASLDGGADTGWTIKVVARSADFVSGDKDEDSEHFDDKTVGEIIKSLASRAGRSAKVHPSIANIKLPYRLRWQQSGVGFAQDLADELGGTLKLANRQWLVTMKGSGETASGTPIPPIDVPFEATFHGGLTAEAKTKYQDVQASYFDPDKGISKLEKSGGLGRSANAFALFPASFADQAKALSGARALDLGRSSISGSVTLEGSTGAMAGAPLNMSGWGGWGGQGLIAQSIEHEFTFDDSTGWTMTIQTAKQKVS